MMKNKLATYWSKHLADIVALAAMPIIGFLLGRLLYRW